MNNVNLTVRPSTRKLVLLLGLRVLSIYPRREFSDKAPKWQWHYKRYEDGGIERIIHFGFGGFLYYRFAK